jgi:hypothetical protein
MDADTDRYEEKDHQLLRQREQKKKKDENYIRAMRATSCGIYGPHQSRKNKFIYLHTRVD